MLGTTSLAVFFLSKHADQMGGFLHTTIYWCIILYCCCFLCVYVGAYRIEVFALGERQREGARVGRNSRGFVVNGRCGGCALDVVEGGCKCVNVNYYC